MPAGGTAQSIAVWLACPPSCSCSLQCTHAAALLLRQSLRCKLTAIIASCVETVMALAAQRHLLHNTLDATLESECSAGGPVDVEWMQESPRVGAILTAWYPGEMARALLMCFSAHSMCFSAHSTESLQPGHMMCR